MKLLHFGHFLKFCIMNLMLRWGQNSPIEQRRCGKEAAYLASSMFSEHDFSHCSTSQQLHGSWPARAHRKQNSYPHRHLNAVRFPLYLHRTAGPDKHSADTRAQTNQKSAHLTARLQPFGLGHHFTSAFSSINERYNMREYFSYTSCSQRENDSGKRREPGTG